MILIDANLLIYAHAPRMDSHEQAREWLDDQLRRSTRVGLPWPSILAFLRVVTNPRIFPESASMADAWERVGSWLRCECVWIPQPTPRHHDVLGGLLNEECVTGNLVMDAHLAALAIEHGLTLCTTDGDFARFRGLRWQNPLRP